MAEQKRRRFRFGEFAPVPADLEVVAQMERESERAYREVGCPGHGSSGGRVEWECEDGSGNQA